MKKNLNNFNLCFKTTRIFFLPPMTFKKDEEGTCKFPTKRERKKCETEENLLNQMQIIMT